MKNNDIAIVFSTWDRSERLWPIIKHSLIKYWPDCPYPFYFTTNFVDGPFGTTLKYGEDEGWSKMMLKLLPQVKERTIIFMMEDYWLWKKVNQDLISDYANAVNSYSIDYIRLIPSPGAIKTYNCYLNEYEKDFMYRTSLGPSIWNKQFFLSLILAEENPWQFEQNSGKRVADHRIMCAVKEAALPIVCEYKNSPWEHEPVEKGNLTEDAFKYLLQENLTLEKT